MGDKPYGGRISEESLNRIAVALLDTLAGRNLCDANATNQTVRLGSLRQIMQKRMELLTLDEVRSKLQKALDVASLRERIYRNGLEGVKLDADMEAQRYHAALVRVTADTARSSAIGGGDRALSWAAKKAIDKGTGKAMDIANRSNPLVEDRWFDAERTLAEPFVKIWNETGANVNAAFISSRSDALNLLKDRTGWLKRVLDDITKDDFEYIMMIEKSCVYLLKQGGVSGGDVYSRKTRICWQFWSSLKQTCELIKQKGNFEARMKRATAELESLEQQLKLRSQHGIRNARPV